jgi:hypothetical protein
VRRSGHSTTARTSSGSGSASGYANAHTARNSASNASDPGVRRPAAASGASTTANGIAKNPHVWLK